jgi:siroheme synthase
MGVGVPFTSTPSSGNAIEIEIQILLTMQKITHSFKVITGYSESQQCNGRVEIRWNQRF